jgi:hypothetical protein
VVLVQEEGIFADAIRKSARRMTRKGVWIVVGATEGGVQMLKRRGAEMLVVF